MKNIRIALFACLVGLFAVACEKEQEEPAQEYNTNIFKLNAVPFADQSGRKVYLHFDSPSTLLYEDGDKIKITSDHGISRDFVIRYRTTSDGELPAVASNGWYAQSDDTLGGHVFYTAFVDGYNTNSANLSGTGPSYSFNINSIKGDANHNKIILAGSTENNDEGTAITLHPACAILRLNPEGKSLSYVKVGFEANAVPKKGTLDARNFTISSPNSSDQLAGVTSGGSGEFLYMCQSNSAAGEDDYWYVAIPVKGSSVTTTLYLEWSDGSTPTQYKTSAQVTMQKGFVYTIGTERPEPFMADGSTRTMFKTSASNVVAFSAGNLQGKRYFVRPSYVNEWRFASNQFTSLKSANASADRNNVWFDLFGYGTSGNTATAQPNTVSTTAGDYPSGDISGGNDDWGVNNSASPGIKYGSTTVISTSWRTLTKDEWEYLIGRAGKVGLATITVDNIAHKGLVLLPDYDEHAGIWSKPDGSEFTAGVSSYSLNQYSASEWSTLENAGAVFLPVTQYRTGTTMDGSDEGYYWTSTGNAGNPGNKSYVLKISEGDVSVVPSVRTRGYAVRLVTTLW